MARIDETQEAIAYVRMAVDNDDIARATQAKTDIEDSVEVSEHSHERHWTFGSPTGARLDTRDLENNFAPMDRDYISFDERLRSFIMHCFPEDAPRYEDLIYVRAHSSNGLNHGFLLHQENRIYIIEEKNWRIILYYLEFAQIIANYMNLHFLLNQKGPRKF